MFDSCLFYCLTLDQETGKWRLVKYTDREGETSRFVVWAENFDDIDDTQMAVGPAAHDEAFPDEVYDDGRYRLKVLGSTNRGKVKQPWPARITPEIIAAIEEGFPKLRAAEDAAIEKRHERREWEEADRQMIRRERALMEEEARQRAGEEAE